MTPTHPPVLYVYELITFSLFPLFFLSFVLGGSILIIIVISNLVFFFLLILLDRHSGWDVIDSRP